MIDPVYVTKAVWNSKLLIIATTILGIAAAVAIATSMPKRYTATTQVLMDPRDLKVVANEITPNGLPSEGTLALVESQTSVLMSSNILSRVIDQANLEADPEFNGQSKSGLKSLLPPAVTRFFASVASDQGSRQYQTLDHLRRALTVGREAKSFVLNLSVETQDPEKSARLANLVSTIFIDEQGRVQSDTARRATDALSSRLVELRQSVVKAESAVEDYKSKNALIGVGGKLVDDEYITRINDQLAKARGDITALRVKADSMRNASVEDVVRGTLPEELASEALVRLRQTYAELAQQEAVLGTKLGRRHPQRIASEGALTASRQAIAGELKRIVAAAQTELARAEATERNLTSQLDALKEKQVTTSGSFVKLRELEREVDASRAVYEAFLLRARETGEQESLNTANVRVISEATPPLLPSSTSRKTVVVAGGVLGFIAGVGIAGLLAVSRLLRAVFADRRRKRSVLWPDEDAEAMRGVSRRATDPAGPADLGPVTAPEAVTPASSDGAPAERSPLPVAPRPVVGEAGEDEAAWSSPRREPDAEAKNASVPAPEETRPATVAGDRREAPVSPGPLLPSEKVPDRQASASLPFEPSVPAAEKAARGMGGGIPLADAGRIADPGARQRQSLRERVRALAEADAQEEAAMASPSTLDPDVASLRDEIQTVKQAIADIRRRRESPTGS